MLIVASPISANRRPSSPGLSGTRTVTSAYRRAAPPCLPGMRATPRRPSSITPANAFITPGAPGPSTAAVRSAPTTSSSEERSASACGSTAPAFAARIADHIMGSDAAIRVTSRTPCPARPSASAGRSASRVAVSDATSCGTWETAATAASCSAASSTTGSEPTAIASRRTAATAPASADSCGQITQVRPWYRSESAAAAPLRSRPAMGCEPT